ncbi:hypothetical protein C8R44DRAFT_891181 [Mycena epipterygia]|nr:hypothetical protein C8R44DRAFT_891181 [Mycena epipterygia]
MPVAPTEQTYNIGPPSKRSPTRRHMHNYSLPSPSSSYAPHTIPRAARCQSSPTSSEFREAVYIPRETRDNPVKDACSKAPRNVRRSIHTTRTPEVSGAALRTAASNPSLSLLAYTNDEEPPPSTHVSTPLARSLSSASSACNNARGLPTLSRTASLSTRTRASPSKYKIGHPKRLSALSIMPLPFPLPPPDGFGSDVEWDIDPFACTSTSYPATQSKWSPDSSTLSLAHQINLPDTGSKKDQSAFEKLKGDIPSPTKLKGFFGKLSINRSPTASGFHFRSASTGKHGEAQGKLSRRPNSLITFGMLDEEKEDPDPLIENAMSTQNDGCDMIDFCSFVADALRLDGPEIEWHDVHSPAMLSATSPVSTEMRPASTQASIEKYIDVDGIAVTEYSSINASIQIPLPECLHASSFPSPTMRAVPNVLATSSDLSSLSSSPGNIYNSAPKPHPNQSRAFAIPPSPRIPPPHPPHSAPPPYGSGFVVKALGLGFLSPPTAPYSSLLSEGDTQTQRPRMAAVPPPSPSTRQLPPLPASPDVSPLQIQKPGYVGLTNFGVTDIGRPEIPPRSKLRPPPVKITTDFSEIPQTVLTQCEESEQCDALLLERRSPTHSRSSSLASLIISPMPTPPLHSRSSSVASFTMSPIPTPPRHSHSSSVASSLIISPMPTPPPLSPTSPASPSSTSIGPGFHFPPLVLPRLPPATPEPQLDMDALRTLILRRGRRSSGCESEDESEVGESLEAIARAHDDEHDDSSACTVTVPEFAWQEEPRAPPSRLSFYESAERIHTTSDIEDDDDATSIYSQFSSTYTFRSRPRSTQNMRRSVRRNAKHGRMSRRMTATSMMSIYSQASFSSQDAMDMPPMPALPWGLKRDSIGNVAEEPPDNDLGEMTFNAPEYAYAYSLDDSVDHRLEGVALAGRTAARSGEDFEAQLPLSTRANSKSSRSNEFDDWRALLTAQATGRGKRRTSSNISIVMDPVVAIRQAFIEVRPAFTDVGSLATNGSIGDISTTSTLIPASPHTLVPNRRQRTVRRIANSPSSPPRSNYQQPSSTSVNFIFDTETENGRSRREISSGLSTPFPFPGPEEKMKKARGVRSGLRGMKSRVSVLTNRLVSLTLPSSRSPSSPSFPTANSPGLYTHRHGTNSTLLPHPPTSPSTGATSASGSPSVSSSSSSSGGSTSTETSPPSSAGASWTPGLANGDALFLSPTATPSTFHMAS